MASNIFGVNEWDTDPETAAELVRLKNEQRMADAMMQRGQNPLQGQMVGRVYVAPSWLQGAANLANSYVAGQRQKSVDQGYKDLAAKRKSVEDAAYSQLGKVINGTPDGQRMYQAGNNPDEESGIGFKAGQAPGTRKQIMETMLGSSMPAMKKAALEMLLKEKLTPTEGFTLTAGASRYGPDGKLIVTAPNKPSYENATTLDKLIDKRAELIAENPNNPNIKVYDNAIRKESEIAQQIVPPTQKIILSTEQLVDREREKAKARELGKAEGQAAAGGVKGSKAWSDQLKTSEGKRKTITLANDFIDSMLSNVDGLIDETGNPREGFNNAFGQWDAMYPNFMKFNKTSAAAKTLDALRAQETMRGLSAAKEQVGQSFGSMQQKEWDRFTNLFKNLDPDQPQEQLRRNLVEFRKEAARLKERNINLANALPMGEESAWIPSSGDAVAPSAQQTDAGYEAWKKSKGLK